MAWTPPVPVPPDRSPKVGIGVIVRFPPTQFNGKPCFVWLRRAGTSHGNGQWSLPGGRLEYGETLLHRATIEVYEEIGIKNFDAFYRIPYISEDFFKEENMHWITFYFIAYPKMGEIAKLMEPHKADAIVLAYEPPGDTFAGATEAIKYANEHSLWLPETTPSP